MISLGQFYEVYETIRPGRPPDSDQAKAIGFPPRQPVFIVAGPGSGKTTCLALRILKLILVDEVTPKGILATTFTKKAAAELRSRILGWGFRMIEGLSKEYTITPEIRERITKVDLNQIFTGTIDSICEQLLRDYRDPGTIPSVIVDDYVAKTMMLRVGLFAGGRYDDPDLKKYLMRIHGSSGFGFNLGRMNDLMCNLWERRFQDQMDWKMYISCKGSKEEMAVTCPPQIGPSCVNAFQTDSRRRQACRRSVTVPKRSSPNCARLTS